MMIFVLTTYFFLFYSTLNAQRRMAQISFIVCYLVLMLLFATANLAELNQVSEIDFFNMYKLTRKGPNLVNRV